MWHLSKRSEYGLLFLVSLAQPSNHKYKSIRIISEEKDLPYRFLSQIASELKKAKLINSKEGKGGGYYLMKKPEDIKVTDIIAVLDEPIGLVDCQRHKGCKKKDTCTLYPVWKKIQGEVCDTLNKYSINDFID